MKTKIIWIIVLFAGMISSMQAQESDPAIDSMIAKQARPIIQANADLMNSLPKSFIKSRDFRTFQKIIKKKNESMEYIGNIAVANDYHEKLAYVNKALKSYNQARKIFEKTQPKS